MAPPWLGILDDTIQACVTHNRQDLAQPLWERRARLLEPTLRILVLGESGQGKSQLINALVNAPVCAVGDDETTRVPAIVEYADTPNAAMIADNPDARGAIEGGAESGRRLPVPIESVTNRANHDAATPGSDVVHARIGLPRGLLRAGLVLVDTPPASTQRLSSVLSEVLCADAVLMATDATSDLSANERELLERVTRICPTVLVALTKIDIVPGWQDVAERTRARLAEDGLPATVVPVSATLRMAAARGGDRVLNAESGFEELVRRLRHDWLERSDELNQRSVAALSEVTVTRLINGLREEHARTQRGGTGDAVTRWHAAGREIEQLQRVSARGQTLLADAVADLTSDLEFDLRDRTRRILREVDEYFEEADPSRTWPEFEEWLEDQLTEVAETNFGWLFERFDWIAHQLARQIAPHRPDLVPDVAAGDPPLEHANGLRRPNVEKFSVGQKLFVGMRGSYSGLLMFGLATTVAGMPLINPISLGAGVAFGLKSVFEERGSRLKRRQTVAKTAAHRHVDDFYLACNKESRDTARRLQRMLRDRYTEYAEQRRAEITASAKELKKAVDIETAEKNRRTKEISTALESLGTLRQRVRNLNDQVWASIVPAPRELTA
ncbi:dynamin family protein [Haloechinothrix salitolerans]|uniref:Dynamin family protein n=1 Tax=Haloechinothrix salitolerans TaxID=926830 RepID=A0ABW2BTD0_9PSEU